MPGIPTGFVFINYFITRRCTRNTAFEHAHAAARQRLLRGEVANFPLGTVAMRALIGPVREPDGPLLLNVFAAYDDAS